jgi:hypothetical protein
MNEFFGKNGSSLATQPKENEGNLPVRRLFINLDEAS